MYFQESRLLPGISVGIELGIVLTSFIWLPQGEVVGEWENSSPICSCWGLQPLQLHGSLCFQARNELASVRQGWAGCLAIVVCVCSIWRENTTARPSHLASRLLAQPDTHPSILPLFSLLSFSWQTVKRIGFWTLSMLWLLWTWKPWRNTEEPASSKTPMDIHENGAASIKSSLKACQSFGKVHI